MQEQNREVLVGKKSVNCLSCGRGDAPLVPPMPTLKGRDGNLYKGDLSKSFAANVSHDPEIDTSI